MPHSESTTTAPAYPRTGLLRRLGALFYDTLVLLALWMLGTALTLLFTGGQAVPPGNPVYQTFLLILSFAYFGGFWHRGGQTVGMKAWRLRVRTRGGRGLTWTHALLRFFGAIGSWLVIGLGFSWSLFDREGLAWHDRFSDTELVVLPKPDQA